MICSLCNYFYTLNQEGNGLCIHCITRLEMLSDDSIDTIHIFFNLEYWKDSGIILNFFKYEFIEYDTFSLDHIHSILKTIKLNNNTYKFLIRYFSHEFNSYVLLVIILSGFSKNQLQCWSCKIINENEIAKEMIYPISTLQELAYIQIKNKKNINPEIMSSVLRNINKDPFS
jgi:hypothetical protein